MRKESVNITDVDDFDSDQKSGTCALVHCQSWSPEFEKCLDSLRCSEHEPFELQIHCVPPHWCLPTQSSFETSYPQVLEHQLALVGGLQYSLQVQKQEKCLLEKISLQWSLIYA